VPSNTYIATWLAVSEAVGATVGARRADARRGPNIDPDRDRGGDHPAHQGGSCRSISTAEPGRHMDAIAGAVGPSTWLKVIEDPVVAAGAGLEGER